MTQYQKNDKLVVQVVNSDNNEPKYDVSRSPYGHWISDDDVLGKLEDFQPNEKKIKMTVGEKKEFDELKTIHGALSWALQDIEKNREYPNLCERLFSNTDVEEDDKAQVEFSCAWGKPSLIKIEEKKYYIHLFKSQDDGYLNQVKDSLRIVIGNSDESYLFKTKFTKDEIEKIKKDLGFKITDDALEEV